ncbi:MAG: shikimate dehydrogenase [Nitrospirae bacterium]|nr:shikimate dehydrogenase [Nitrospirota bacterium]
MDVSGKTKITGLFGYPVEHTLSPAMHNAAFKSLGLDICYVPFNVSPEELPNAVRAVRALNLIGVNITIPHKEKVIPLLDRVSEEASFIGAVNTVVNNEGTLTGHNTDGRGFISSLTEKGVLLDNKEILVIGAGGASRAISYYLSEKASKLFLYDVDKPKAERLISDLKKIRNNVFRLDDTKDIGTPNIIINATPLGLKQEDPLPLNPDFITPDTVVCDLIYKKTKLLQEADNRGAVTLDGLGMLLWQGVLAFELWTGFKPPVDLMRKALLSNIR